MRWRIATTIFRKELLETLRDRRTLLVMLLLPMVMYPLLIIAFGQVVTHQMSQMQEQKVRVWIKGPLPYGLRRQLADAEAFEALVPDFGPAAPESMPILPPKVDEEGGEAVLPFARTQAPEEMVTWARRMIDRSRTDAVLVVPLNIEQVLAEEGSVPIAILYDETVHESRTAKNRIEDALLVWREALRDERLERRPELPEGFFLPVLIDSQNTATAQKRGGFLAGRIIPLVLMVMVMLGAFYPAIDLTAGEKERGTMQTLLTAPARPTEIIMGKFFTVFTVAMLSALANLVSMAMAIAWMLRSSPRSEEFIFHVDFSTVLLVLVQLVPIAVFFSALMLAIAVFAHSFKEAQNYLTPVYILVIVPAAIAALPSVRLDLATSWAPGLNIMLLLREMLQEPPAAWLIAMVMLANTLYAAGALALAVKIFQNEQVLLGGQTPVGEVLDLVEIRHRRPRPMLALIAFGVLLVLLYYVGSAMQEADIFWGMLGTQWVLLFLPVAFLVRMLKLDPHLALSICRPRWRGVLGAVLIGMTAWAVVGHFASWLQNMVLPVPLEFEERMREALGLDDLRLMDWQLLLAFCISPAICEEFFFRGLILGSLRGRLGKWTVIVFTALMFGFFHLSIYRIFPTAVLGLVITWVVFQTGSLWTGVLVHGINNFIGVMAMKYNWLPGLTGAAGDGLDWRWMAVAILVFVAGLLVIGREEESPCASLQEGDPGITGIT